MPSQTGRYVVTFNGEIYNFAAIRAELGDGIAWRGHSDTEVLLAAVERWGVRAAIERCAGMFAIVLWDREDHALHLIRDRLGEKPLYYGSFDGTLLFGSELKALRAHPAWHSDISLGALSLYLRAVTVSAPQLRSGAVLHLRKRQQGCPGDDRNIPQPRRRPGDHALLVGARQRRARRAQSAHQQ
jgi:asparagine synthase (glutamine-hydrolysing)